MNAWIIKFLNHRESHANLLHTFSWLEFMGARKMVRTLANPLLYNQYLDHVIEEFNHARVFKELAQQISNGSSTPQLIVEFEVYFNALETQCVRRLNQKLSICDSERIYQATTFLIERRALDIYKAYYSLYSPHQNYLQRILNEENIHLGEVRDEILNSIGDTALQELIDDEQKIFQNMINSLEFHDESHGVASIL